MSMLLTAALASVLASASYDPTALEMRTVPSEAQYARAMLDMTTRYRNPTEREKYYRIEHMAEYADAVFTALAAADRLSPPYLALMAATLDQQTRFQPDSVSTWNRDERGERIIVPRARAWKKPDRRLDYGIYQFNYGTGMRYGREAFGEDFALRDLLDPDVSLALAVRHVADQEGLCRALTASRDSRRCAPYLTGRRYCRKPECPLTCRCLLVRTCTGVEFGTKNGNPSSLCEYVDKYWRALERVLLEDQQQSG